MQSVGAGHDDTEGQRRRPSGCLVVTVGSLAFLTAISATLAANRVWQTRKSLSECARAGGPRANGRIAFLATSEPPKTGAGETPGSVFGDSRLFVVNPDGSGLRRIRGEFRSLHLSWSPDGQQIALDYGGGEFPPRNIFILGLKDSTWTEITDADSFEGSPAWCPNGTAIAFSSSRCCDTRDSSYGNNYELYLADPAADLVGRLTSTNGLHETDPAWSPDGTQLAYSAWHEGPAQLWVRRMDSASSLQMTRGELSADSPSWSADGRRIAFVAGFDDLSRLDVANADGTERKTLVDCRVPCAWIRDAVWSPEGTSILFTEFRKESENHQRGFLRIFELSTGIIRDLDVGDLNACCPAWESVDASRVN
jgi:Tol biopolymer transport system component